MAFRHTNDRNHVGIVNFFENKTIFITGSTGFMGKVFVEKILRVVPTVKKIYLLVKANDAETAMQRLKTQIIDSKLFKVIREKHGQSYEDFMWSKLVPIVGDLRKPYLGMDTNSADLIRSEVNVIVHMGANTKWHDRHDISLELNVRAVSRLVDFAMDCMNLVLYLHVSSAYATQAIPGVSFEKPIELGQYSTEDGEALGLSIEQLIDTEMRVISEVAIRIQEEEQEREMLKLGMRRAKFYKMENNYQLTKSMGEMVATKLMEKLPVVILRPSTVESTFQEPFPGWIEGYKSLDPIILSYGTGQLEGFVANPHTTMDVVPVDMVTNAMMTAMAKHGNERKHGVYFYNVTSSIINPLTFHDIFNFCTLYFTSHPLKDDSNGDVIRVKDMQLFESTPEFILAGLGAITTSYAKLRFKFMRMAAIYEPFTTQAGWFDDKNTRKLLGEMSLEESDMFNFNFGCINWKDYFTNIHIPGIIQHVLNNKKTLSSRL